MTGINIDVKTQITNIIRRRAKYILKQLKPLISEQEYSRCNFWIGGGALNGTINDVDLFPSTETSFHCFGNNAKIIVALTLSDWCGVLDGRTKARWKFLWFSNGPVVS